mgnify:CR=1 FL=1
MGLKARVLVHLIDPHRSYHLLVASEVLNGCNPDPFSNPEAAESSRFLLSWKLSSRPSTPPLLLCLSAAHFQFFEVSIEFVDVARQQLRDSGRHLVCADVEQDRYYLFVKRLVVSRDVV